MNTILATKIETCLELCNSDPDAFKKYVLKVTSLTDKGFHDLNRTDVAFEMLKRGESVEDTIKAVI